MSKAEERYLDYCLDGRLRNCGKKDAFLLGYHQAEKDVAEAFARIIRGNLGGIGNGIQKEFERIYTKTTGKKMYGGFKD